MKEEIHNCMEVLRKGGIILYPTDTVWGLGCDARNSEAVNKLFKLKQRATYKSMAVLVCNENMLDRYVQKVPDVAWQLIDAAEKPLTIIYPDGRSVASNLIAADESIGIRLIQDKFCNDLIYRFGKPIVSTSANISGEKTPFSFAEISEDLIKGVDYVVNLRQDETNNPKPSTIIRLSEKGEIKIVRE